MSTPPLKRSVVIVVLLGAIAGLLLLGVTIVLLGVGGEAQDAALDAAANPVPASSPGAHATATPRRTASPSPTPSPSPTASPSPSPQADAPLTDLTTLVPERVAGFRQTRNRPARDLLDQPGAQEARRVDYRNTDGVQVTHLVALYESNRAAGAALRQRRAQVLQRRGARVFDDTGLEDSDGVRRGRLMEVRTRRGDVIVLWRNRNLVGVLGPGRHRLHRRLYDAWPY